MVILCKKHTIRPMSGQPPYLGVSNVLSSTSCRGSFLYQLWVAGVALEVTRGEGITCLKLKVKLWLTFVHS